MIKLNLNQSMIELNLIQSINESDSTNQSNPIKAPTTTLLI